ncbi:Hypothetical protein I596_2707 [Dokdonella koreensis DS-123]|uniref:Uncharacterized protein n=1 Tax=Dokdonella koreensis DS-123 TaxID=1300342 RepID=A0A167H3A5_9GAMM|nr:Hypothetical protein I596_2707 [Dokdonella koreensis DS-123]
MGHRGVVFWQRKVRGIVPGSAVRAGSGRFITGAQRVPAAARVLRA